MLIRIAIVDDQPEARELLRQDLLVRAPAGTSIACFDSSESFLSGFSILQAVVTGYQHKALAVSGYRWCLCPGDCRSLIRIPVRS